MQADCTVRAGAWGRALGPWWRRLAPLILAAAVLSAVGLAAGRPASGGRQAAPADATAAGAHPGGLASLSRLSVQGQSVISSTVAAGDPRFAPRPRTGGFGLTGGGTAATLGRDGVSVDGGGGRLSFGGLAVGRTGRLQPLAAVAPQAHADRVTYARGAGVSEWYTAGPLGVEQGFTLSRRPRGRSGAATLALALAGSPARIAGNRVEFLAPSGRVALRYGGLVASDARGRRLAARLSLSGSRLLVRVADRGARYPLRIDPFIQQGSKLTATDETGQGVFGDSVALSADGNTALIGAPLDNNLAGAAWVFVRSGTTWTQQGAKLVSSATDDAFRYGSGVALSSDGNTALIGGDGGDGGALVFTRSGSSWTRQGAELVGTGASGGAGQGSSVALSGDGNTALLGGPNDRPGNGAAVGAAWVFVRSGSAWTQQGSKLTASDESGLGGFGWSVALSNDGDTALIGGPTDNNDVGATWEFARTDSAWTQQGSKLVGTGAANPAQQGSSVALTSDGNTALIGGPGDNNGVGAAWAFARSGVTWGQQGSKLTASDESGQGGFGSSVALAGDGETALIGGSSDNNNVGAAWEFAPTDGAFTQQGSKLVGAGAGSPAQQGSSVALSSDGNTALVGGPFDTSEVGAAWAFEQHTPPSLYWDNPQVGPCPGNQACPSIGRGTIDGNPANVNQNFITDIPQASHVGVAVGSQNIYWAGGFVSAIGRANLDGSGVNQQLIGVGAISIAVDDHHIYWAGTLTDVATGGPTPYVGRANLDGSGVDTQFIDVQGGALSVAVDSSHVYWTDPSGNRIGRANLDGTGVDPSFITGVVNPWGVAVDGQHIFWTHREGTSPPYSGSIGRANLDASGVSPDFITGASEPEGIAVDYNHVYWANYYDCSNNQTQSGCAGGTIGRANLDGSGVNQSFLAADSALGSGCDLFNEERCGPSSVAVSAPTQPVCLRTSPTPAPPPGGAVFAQPLDPSSSDANVVVIPAGVNWTGPGSCTGIAQGSDAVMTHPASIAVAPDAAVLLRDQPAGLESAWGAQNAGTQGPAPVLFPGRSDWQTTEADMIAPQQLLDSYDGCPGCALPDKLQLSPGQTNSDVAYQHDLSGATLNGATLTGRFAGWDFSGARLPGATLNGTDVSGADFTGADLRGAHLTALVQTPPATFANVRVGALNGSCTTFTNSSLVGTGFTPVKSDLLVSGCETTPLLPGSIAPLDLIHLLVNTDQATVDFFNAQFLVTATNRDVLAGADLNGINLAGAKFVGFPPDLESTKFNGASLQKTVFQLADLANAQFQGAVAPGVSFEDANLNGAKFAGMATNLQNADFIQADVSDASLPERGHLQRRVQPGTGGWYQL